MQIAVDGHQPSTYILSLWLAGHSYEYRTLGSLCSAYAGVALTADRVGRCLFFSSFFAASCALFSWYCPGLRGDICFASMKLLFTLHDPRKASHGVEFQLSFFPNYFPPLCYSSFFLFGANSLVASWLDCVLERGVQVYVCVRLERLCYDFIDVPQDVRTSWKNVHVYRRVGSRLSIKWKLSRTRMWMNVYKGIHNGMHGSMHTFFTFFI